MAQALRGSPPATIERFERNGHLVLSLVAEPQAFAEGLRRIETRLRGWPDGSTS